MLQPAYLMQGTGDGELGRIYFLTTLLQDHGTSDSADGVAQGASSEVQRPKSGNLETPFHSAR